ncbi:MAG TPA: tail fiber domain-containing protein, partial [Candidatus Saccharimonadales bacterium]|nr:tail fiber domain-containing protein [Candidatus Saccharimonadales bacterium]
GDIGNAGIFSDSGIIRIGTQGTHTATYLAGTVFANGVQLTSDRNAKENFIAVNAREVLARVAALPVTQWNYKTDSKAVQHIGPMAQDFQAAFQLSADDRHISVVDEGGVALAAIQGLNQKLDEKDAEIKNLEKKLDALQAMVKQLAANK